MVPRTASRRLTCPCITLLHVGELESSKSAMKTLAPELSALMIILRSTGPVISTRRSIRSAGIGATCHSLLRICAVAVRNSGMAPLSISCWRARRSASSSRRRGSKARASLHRKRMASSLSMDCCASVSGAVIWIDFSCVANMQLFPYASNVARTWKIRSSGCPIRTSGPIRPSAFAARRNPASTTNEQGRGATRVCRPERSGEEMYVESR